MSNILSVQIVLQILLQALFKSSFSGMIDEVDSVTWYHPVHFKSFMSSLDVFCPNVPLPHPLTPDKEGRFFFFSSSPFPFLFKLF